MAEPQPTGPQSASSATGTEKAPPSPQSSTSATQPTPPNEPSKDERSRDAMQTALREVAEKLRLAVPALSEVDKSLAQAADTLARQASDPIRLNQRSFQHELAYMIQDVGRTPGVALNLTNETRDELSKLAGSAPGLENQRMRALMRSTGEIEDRALVRDIRRTGSVIGEQANQNTLTIRGQIDVLENRVRLAPRPDVAPEATGSTQTGRPTQPEAPPGRQAQTDTASQGERTRSPGDAPRQNQDRPILVQGASGGSAIDTIFRALRATGPANTPPWESGAQPFGQRLSAFEDKLLQGRDEVALRGVERSGRAALEALEGFRNGEGAVVLNRIREAARTDPGGMAAVMSEMREGGKFADFRQQFNNALSDEKGVTAAYDKAAGALARYGQDRIGAEQIIARRPDAANLSAKFEAMDKDIGAAAVEIPSRRDGKTMLEDLSRQVAELLQKAADSVKSIFSHGPSQSASASGPAPG